LHHLLLALLVAAVVLGVSNVWVRGDTFFVLKIPEFDPGNRALRGLVGDLHAYVTNAIVILAGVHALAALYHHYILRDSVLRRMLPR
ncbi:MAG: cytochrome b/b6 domain-containing protein, partial [Nevskia sp.]|nr:cytochrome b/b6 domain-containing protein [Nevskia sp.]